MANVTSKATAQAVIVGAVSDMLINQINGNYTLTVQYDNEGQQAVTTISATITDKFNVDETACNTLAELGMSAKIISIVKNT